MKENKNETKRVNYPAMLMCDFYKTSHREQYPVGTTKLYSTWTPRTSRKEGINKVVAFGFQGFIKDYLIDYFNKNFFNKPLEEVVNSYKRVIKNCLGKDKVDCSHIEALHKLGYLPIKICAVPEGTLVPIRVPMLTIENTIDEFFWLTNYLETLISTSLWQPITSATISCKYRDIMNYWYQRTVTPKDVIGNFLTPVALQGHDFSMRGMSSLETTKTSGAGHLLNFGGTDSIPSILYLEKNYNTNIEKDFVGVSVSATEHSVQCSYGQENELETYKHLLTKVYPTSVFSAVFDTWDFWDGVINKLPKLKNIIMARDGKFVVRPDSGVPEDILCGNPNAKTEHERKGLIEILWEQFGGTTTEQGYKLLDSHIGAIYGDAITLERCNTICERLAKKGFASSNVVFGLGSYGFQMNTRDTFGFAIKSTYAVINGEERFLFKNPKTDNGVKKSQRGKVYVFNYTSLSGEEIIKFRDGLNQGTYDLHEKNNLLKPIFIDGELVRETSLKEIRNRLAEQNYKVD